MNVEKREITVGAKKSSSRKPCAKEGPKGCMLKKPKSLEEYHAHLAVRRQIQKDISTSGEPTREQPSGCILIDPPKNLSEMIARRKMIREIRRDINNS